MLYHLIIIRTRHFALKVPATPPVHLTMFVDKITWNGGPTGLAVKREVDVLVEPYLSMPMWAPCLREYKLMAVADHLGTATDFGHFNVHVVTG